MRFLIILLFLGGIMVLFVYICRLISRIKIFIKNLYLKGALVLSGGVFLTLILINYLEDYSLHFCTFNLSPIYQIRIKNFTFCGQLLNFRFTCQRKIMSKI